MALHSGITHAKLRGMDEMPGVKPGTEVYKANAYSSVLSLQAFKPLICMFFCLFVFCPGKEPVNGRFMACTSSCQSLSSCQQVTRPENMHFPMQPYLLPSAHSAWNGSLLSSHHLFFRYMGLSPHSALMRVILRNAGRSLQSRKLH